MTEKSTGEIAGLVVRDPLRFDPAALIPDPPAKRMFDRVAHHIIEFEKILSPDQEIGGRFVSAPKEGVFHIENISYAGGDMLIFHGHDSESRPIMLLQHYSQMSVLLCAIPKEKDKARRIGFLLEQQFSGKKSEAT